MTDQPPLLPGLPRQDAPKRPRATPAGPALPPWTPHQRDTWPWRIGTLRRDVRLAEWHGHGANPEFTYRLAPAGTKVKIVMVSRFGDVGITDDLSAETGYAARVQLADIEPPEDAPPDARLPHPPRP